MHSSQNKRQQLKKINRVPPRNVDSQGIGDEDSDSENFSNSLPILENAAAEDVDPAPEVDQSNETRSLTLLTEDRSLVCNL